MISKEPSKNIEIYSMEPEEFTSIFPDSQVMSFVVPDDEIAEDVDIGDGKNEFAISIYARDVYEYLRQMEKKYQPKKKYMSFQANINPRSRAYMVDWLVEMHRQLSQIFERPLQIDTLFLSVSIFDRFLSLKSIAADKIFLVGLGSFYIASKFEETYYPSIDQLLRCANSNVKKEDVIRVERIILNELGFAIGAPTSICFLKRYAKLARADCTVGMLSRFMTEYALSSYSLSTNYLPSQIAAAATSLSLRIVNKPPWTATLQEQTGYKHDDLLPVLTELRDIIRKSPLIKTKAIFRKYSDLKYLQAALIAVKKV